MTPQQEHLMRAVELILLQEYWSSTRNKTSSIAGLSQQIKQMIDLKFDEERNNPFVYMYRVLMILDTEEGMSQIVWEVLERCLFYEYVPDSKHVIMTEIKYNEKRVYLRIGISQMLFKNLLEQELAVQGFPDPKTP